MYSDEIRAEAVRLYGLGISTYEIGERLGVAHQTVTKWAHEAGLHRGKGNGCAAKANAKRNSEAMERMSAALGDRFEVIELNPESRAKLRCKTCGDVFERKVDLRYPTTCFNCRRVEAEKKAAERKAEASKRTMHRNLVNAFKKFLGFKLREQRAREILDAIHVCKECGKPFTLRERRETNPWDYSDKPTFCSLACSHRYHGRKAKHRRREREHDGDCDLSLRELDERDNSTCYLCGYKTEWDDYRIDGSGNFIAGDLYPSMDHVAPIAKGGMHTQENLRIAHRLCNALKGDRTISEARLLIKERWRGVPD